MHGGVSMGIKERLEELKKIKNTNEVENDEEIVSLSKESNKMIKNRIILMEPQDFSKTEEAAELVKSGHSVILNLNMLNEKSAQRLIDYLNGVVYALGGTIESIGLRVVLIAPACTEVHGKIVNSSDV